MKLDEVRAHDGAAVLQARQHPEVAHRLVRLPVAEDEPLAAALMNAEHEALRARRAHVRVEIRAAEAACAAVVVAVEEALAGLLRGAAARAHSVRLLRLLLLHHRDCVAQSKA